MVEVVRNIQVKLNIPESRHSDVDQTFEEFRQAAQHVADHGWSDDPDHLTKAKNKLHKATYTKVREKTISNPASSNQPETLPLTLCRIARTCSKTIRTRANQSSEAPSSCTTGAQLRTTTTT